MKPEQIACKKWERKKLFEALPSVVILLGLTILIYSSYRPALSSKFVWDDAFLVTANPMIKSPVLGLEVFRHFLFEDARNEFYRPVQLLTYIFDYWRGGPNPAVFHQTNLSIHWLNSVLIFFLGRRLLTRVGNFSERGSFWAAAFLAAAWAVHPVHSAITSYVSGRADSLALFGLLGGWVCWERGIISRSGFQKWLFLGAPMLALVACCSKEIALACLAIFVVYLWLLRSDLSTNMRIKTSMGVLVVFLGYFVLRQLPEANVKPAAEPPIATMERAQLFSRAMGDYARLFVFPKQLFMERQVSLPTGLFTNPVENDPLFPYLGIVGIGCLLGLLASMFWRGNAQKLRWLGAIWFGAAILPVSNLFILNATVAEHWLYIPSLGLFFWVLACWRDLPSRLRRVAIFLSPLAILCLGIRSHFRANDWKDPITFYRATIRDGGDSIRIRVNLAGEYWKQGKRREAEKIYRSILQVRPDYGVAATLLEKLLSTDGPVPGHKSTENIALPKDESLDIEPIRIAYAAHPNSWLTAKSLIDIYQRCSQPRAALAVAQGFAGRNWWHADSHKILGGIQAELGDHEGAVASYLAASRLDVWDANSLNHAAAILGDAGQFSEAIALQKQAIARDGGAPQWKLLAELETLARKTPP